MDVFLSTTAKDRTVKEENRRYSEKRPEDGHRVTKGGSDVVRRHFEVVVLNNMSKRAFKNVLGRTVAL